LKSKTKMDIGILTYKISRREYILSSSSCFNLKCSSGFGNCNLCLFLYLAIISLVFTWSLSLSLPPLPPLPLNLSSCPSSGSHCVSPDCPRTHCVDWPWTQDPPVPVSQGLGLQACAPTQLQVSHTRRVVTGFKPHSDGPGWFSHLKILNLGSVVEHLSAQDQNKKKTRSLITFAKTFFRSYSQFLESRTQNV
jgi:hypothetical protein